MKATILLLSTAVSLLFAGCASALTDDEIQSLVETEVAKAVAELKQGPHGPQGEVGIAGPVGPQGNTGPEGAQGEVGPPGPNGPTGDSGPVGASGPRGVQGETGKAGPIGLTGRTGSTGPIGATGPRGLSGPSGPAGPAGVANLSFADHNRLSSVENCVFELVSNLSRHSHSVNLPDHSHSHNVNLFGSISYWYEPFSFGSETGRSSWIFC